jgi:hypothetical protein
LVPSRVHRIHCVLKRVHNFIKIVHCGFKASQPARKSVLFGLPLGKPVICSS